MLLGGDELGHTQQGNNNTYCQDNELTWLSWELNPEQQGFLGFVQKIAALRHSQPVFQRRTFFQGRRIRGTEIKDISWLGPDGKEMSDEAWGAGFAKCLGVRLAGDVIGDVDEHGQPIVGETLLMLLNAHHEPISFQLPATRPEHHWQTMMDTAEPDATIKDFREETIYQLQGRSVAVLRAVTEELTGQRVTPIQVETLGKEGLSPLSRVTI